MLQEYSSYLKKDGLSAITRRAYLSDINKFKHWYCKTSGELTLNNVRDSDIAKFKRYLQSKKQKPATINRVLVSLSSFFDWAVDRSLVASNPVSNVKYVKETKTIPRYLSEHEQLSLIQAVMRSEKDRDIAIIIFLLYTGLKVTEMCRLTIDDVVLKKKSSFVIVTGQNNEQRKIPLNATVRNALKKWLSVRGQEPGALFTSQKGGGLSTRAVERLVKKYARYARLDGVTPSVLRHTFCKSLLDSGASVEYVAALAGHKSLNTTAKYINQHTEPTQLDLQEAVEELELSSA